MRILWLLVLFAASGCTKQVCEGLDPSCSAAMLFPWMKVIKPRYFYGSDQSPNSSVTQHYVDYNSGTLTQIAPKFSLAPATSIGQMTSDINGRFLYAASGSGVVSIMKIGATTGALSFLANVPVSGTTPFGIVYDVQQRFVFVSTTGGSGTISTFAPSFQTGGLTLLSTFNPSVVCANAGGIAAHPGGRFLYCATGTTIGGLAIDQSTGALSNLSTATATGSVQSLAFDSTGTLLLVSTNTNAEAYSINTATGALTQRSTQAFAGMGAYGIAVIQNNLYVPNSTGIRALAFDSAGNISNVAVTTTGTNCLGIAAEASGRFIYYFSGSGLAFAMYRNADGSLSTLPPTGGLAAGSVMVYGHMSSPLNTAFVSDTLY